MARVEGSRVVGVGPGVATISAHDGLATVDVTVEAAVVQPELVPRVVTSLTSATSRSQSFESEDDVGYLYTHVRYANGDVHTVADDELLVEVLAPETLWYELVGGRHRIGVVPNAAAADCSAPLLRVNLSACGGSLISSSPPLELQLPSPAGLQPLLLSTSFVAADDSFARHAALSSRPARQGTVTQALVVMSEGPDKDMAGDARVTLRSSSPGVAPRASRARV